MIDKGRKFESEIKALRALRAKAKKNSLKYEDLYISMRNQMAHDNKVSVRQVQTWLNKKSPWIRNKRDDAGKERVKLPAKVKTMLHDAIDAGRTKKEALKLVANKTGSKLSDYKGSEILKNDEPNNAAGFADDFKQFLTDYFQLDLIPTHKGIKLKFKKLSYTITKNDIDDILMILTNAFNRFQYASENKLKLDRNYLRRVRTWHLFEQIQTLASERIDPKLLNSLTLSLQRLEIDPAKFNTPNYKTLENICRELKPDITFDEIFDMLEKYN